MKEQAKEVGLGLAMAGLILSAAYTDGASGVISALIALGSGYLLGRYTS